MVYKNFIFLFLIVVLYGCSATLQPVQVVKNKDYKTYKYALINKTESVVSTSGYSSSYNYGYGYSYTTNSTSIYSQSINPADYIAGYLMKQNIIIVNEIKQPKNTMVIHYGHSGIREIAGGLLGYTTEVTIQIIDAYTQKLIAKCTAEGFGSTETEDTRIAITRCLDSLTNENVKE